VTHSPATLRGLNVLVSACVLPSVIVSIFVSTLTNNRIDWRENEKLTTARNQKVFLSDSSRLSSKTNYGSGGWGFESLRARQFMTLSPPQVRATANRPRKMNWDKALSVLSALSLAILWIPACTTSTTTGPTIGARGPTEAQRGFFERLADELTERECEVFRFTCPYGLGPAGEPCECTGPNGVVLKGRTIK
jgi:hypothetical protein